MIESWLRGRMQRLVFRLQVHPQLERFRVHMPYFVVVGFITVLLELPAAGIIGLAQLLGYRGTPEVSLTRSWLTLALLPLGFMALFAAITAVGRLSGYRPFRYRWEGLSLRQLQVLSRELQQAAEGKGFAVVWRAGAAGGDFVSVRNMDLERSYSMNLGNRFPMRLSLTVHRRPADQADATLMVANRTCVVWHSGERDVCRETGEAIIAACTQPVPQQR